VSAGGTEGTTSDAGNLFVLVSNLVDSDVDKAFASVQSAGFADDLLLRVLGDFLAVGGELSHAICSRFFHVYVRSWLEHLDAKPPRAVAHAAAAAIALRLAIAVEQVVLPTVARPAFNAFQRAVLSKALTTGLPKSRRSDVVDRLCRASVDDGASAHWCDERASLLHDLLQGNAHLTPSALDGLARGLAINVAARPESKPLSKVALSVLQRPREELLPVREHLERACNSSATVTSKSLLAALRRLQPQAAS
jgi:hypothetical protein